jgi:hypothetical protein
MNTGAAVVGLTGGATAPEKSRCFRFRKKIMDLDIVFVVGDESVLAF